MNFHTAIAAQAQQAQISNMEMPDKMDWIGRKVLILGAARQGTALARYLVQHGARVILNDKRSEDELQAARQSLSDLESATDRSLEWVLGGHPSEVLDGIDLVCVSGGVPLSLPLVIEARELGIPLSNDSQIFLDAAPCQVIGITGSAGKTTTTSLVGHIAQTAQPLLTYGEDRQVWVGGNIGKPLISVVDQMDAEDLAVMEISSFQLELMTRSPYVAAVLNVTPNHLDRHGTMEAYTAVKARILDFQTPEDVGVLGRDDPGAWDLVSHIRGELISFGLEPPSGGNGTFIKDNQLFYRSGEVDTWIMSQDSIRLRGEHNLRNVLAACAIAGAIGISAEAMRMAVEAFVAIPHRLEYVRSWGGADWYNDSIATAPERAMAAIQSFDRPLLLLAGGRDKDLPWDDFARLVVQRVDHVIAFGEAAAKIIDALERNSTISQPHSERPSITSCGNLRQAVDQAAQIVKPGEVVLLSPGGTSYDEFRDFEERGECFKQQVMKL